MWFPSENEGETSRGDVGSPRGASIARPLPNVTIVGGVDASGVAVGAGPSERVGGMLKEIFSAKDGRVMSLGVGALQIAVPKRPAIASARSQMAARRAQNLLQIFNEIDLSHKTNIIKKIGIA